MALLVQTTFLFVTLHINVILIFVIPLLSYHYGNIPYKVQL